MKSWPISIIIPMFALLCLGSAAAIANPPVNSWQILDNGQNKKKPATNGARNSGAIIVVKSSVGNGGHWKLVPVGGGKYRIQNRHSGMYMANFGSRSDYAPIKQTNNPGTGALWRMRPQQGGYYMIVNDLSGMYLGLGGQQDGANLVQTHRASGMTTWRFLAAGNASSPANSTASPARSNGGWQETPIPGKYMGNWKIASRYASRNDVYITSGAIKSGSFSMRVVKSYQKDGIYKVITTANNYYQCHYIRDRSGGIGNGGISINSTNQHAFRSFGEANALPYPSRMDMGYR